MHSPLALLGQGICDRDNRDASTHSTWGVTWASRDSNPMSHDNPRPAARMDAACGRRGMAREPRPVTGGIAARAGGSRTRIVASFARIVPSSSDHGIRYGDAVLCGSLLSYGIRRRAANAHARQQQIEREGEVRARDL